MKIKTLFFSAALLMVLNASAATLDAWVGKYPSSKIQGITANDLLLNKGALKRLLPSGERALIKSFTVEDLVSRDGDYVVAFKCKPHGCSGENALLVEGSGGQFWVAIYQSKAGVVSTRWYGASDHSTLPKSIQQLFMRGHVPE